MITYIDSALANKYSTLFEDADVKAILGNDDITTANVIAHISELINIRPAFARLPIDEEVFEIDANARTITVPKAFSSNGVGVIGDELAEVVYFKIARFFDYADFNNFADKIYIQWQNANGEAGVSKAINIDSLTDPDYLYFGWAFTDSLTNKAGTIKFNVRIISATDTELKYSFNTQQASVSIKNSLNYDLVEMKNGADALIVDDNVADIIAERLLGASVAKKVTFTTNLEEEVSVNTELKVEIEEVEEGTKVFYKWYKNGILYTEDADGNPIAYYKPTLTVTETGEYYVVVLTSLSKVDSQEKDTDGNLQTFQEHISIMDTKSNTCKVPAPVQIEFAEDGQISNVYVIDPENPLTVKVTKDTSANAVLTCSAIFTDYAVKSDDEHTYMTTDKKGNVVFEIPEEDFKTENTIDGVVDANGVAQINPIKEGYYKVIVINSLNNAETTVTSNICRVTKPAEAPTVTITNTNGVLTAEAVLADGALSDELAYQWSRKSGDSFNAISGATSKTYDTKSAAGTYNVTVTNNVNGSLTPSDLTTTAAVTID